MNPFTVHTGIVAALDRPNVDTDQIIPKQFLKRVERTGFGEFLFFDWRYLDGQQLNPNFPLNAVHARDASILLARQNFGSGSSREHAVWALEDYGFRAVVAPSFADIFYNNCFKNGVLPVVLNEQEVDELFARAKDRVWTLTVDLQRQVISSPDGFSASFHVDPTRKHNLLHGLDDIALTLQYAPSIADYEARHPLPSL